MGSSLPGESSIFLCWGRFYFFEHTFIEHLLYAKSSYILYIENTAVYKIDKKSYMYSHAHMCMHIHLFIQKSQ